jgi:hypothetical protein
MNRIDFIRSIVLGTAGTALPVSSIPKEWVKQYDKFYLLHSFVRGFQYYEGLRLLEEMKEGDMLELVREPDNEHDKYAIALHWNNHKIGYIPRERNNILSKLLDIGILEMMAEISFVNTEAAHWENVRMALYVLKERPVGEDIPITAEKYTTLLTPRYYSIRHENKQVVTRIALPHDKRPVVGTIPHERPDYYEFLETNYPNDAIYGYIHDKLDGETNYGKKDRIFVMKKKIVKKKGLRLSEAMEQIDA